VPAADRISWTSTLAVIWDSGKENIRLSEKNLTRYMHAFTYLQKLGFTGKHDVDLHFECFDVFDYCKSYQVVGYV
jgi:hypothetical protein